MTAIVEVERDVAGGGLDSVVVGKVGDVIEVMGDEGCICNCRGCSGSGGDELYGTKRRRETDRSGVWLSLASVAYTGSCSWTAMIRWRKWEGGVWAGVRV